MHAGHGTIHGVVACSMPFVVLARAGAGGTGVVIINVAAVGIAVVHILVFFVRVWWRDLRRWRASGYVLLGAISATAATLIIVVIIAWRVVWLAHGDRLA